MGKKGIITASCSRDHSALRAFRQRMPLSWGREFEPHQEQSGPSTIDVSCSALVIAYCRACGHSYQLDMRHKLTTFILKNPPGTKLNDTGTSLTERKDKKSKRKQDEETNGGTNGNHD